MRYTRDDVCAALRSSGLARGDIVFFSTSLGMLGIADGIASADDLNRLFLDAFREVLGDEGTILVPAYSYTFGASTASRPAVFDPASTPARIGPFPEYFRQQPGVLRSEDPMMSIAGLGPAAAELFRDLPPSSYGADSVFARLLHWPAKCCNVGLGPNWTPFIHHADWLARVPFRYDKLFAGEIVRDGRREPLDWLYSVRILSDAGRADAHRLGKLAEEAGIWRWAKLGRGRVYTAGYRAYFDFAMRELRRDPWIQATGPAGDPVQLEEERVGRRDCTLAWPPDAPWTEQMRALGAVPRPCVSDGFDAALRAVAAELPLTVHAYPSGTACYDWIVPEKWQCRRASVAGEDGRLLLSAPGGPGEVVAYSLAFEGEVGADELAAHLHVRPARPPFDERFMRRDWGFVCTAAEAARLTSRRYRVSIDSDVSFGRMSVGEVRVPGRGRRSLLVCVHLGDAPGQPETLSGVLIALDWLRQRKAAGPAELGVRLLLLPGTVGLAAWMAQYESELGDVVAAVTLRGLSGDAPHLVQLSRTADTLLDQRVRQLLPACDPHGRIAAYRQVWDEYPSGGNPLRRAFRDWGKLPMLTIGRRPVDAAASVAEPQLSTRLAQSRALLGQLLDGLPAGV